jgi:hypothetical protein
MLRFTYWALICALGYACLLERSPIAAAPSHQAQTNSPFTLGYIAKVEIELSPEALTSLNENGRRYVRARVIVDGRSFTDVGLHLKGRSSFQPLLQKSSFTLDFGRFVQGQRFAGLRKVHLNNSLEDKSFVREWLGSAVFRAAGIPAPDVAHATVGLNGRLLGFYVLKEGFSEEFFQRVYGQACGSVYDIDAGHDVDSPMVRRKMGDCSNANGSVSEELAAAVAEPEAERRWDRLSLCLDLPEFIRFMVVEVMICHWDGYSLARNNFRMFQPAGGLTVFLPAGMDQAFANPRLDWKPHMAGLVAQAVMDTSQGKEQFSAVFRQVFAQDFSATRMSNQLARLVFALRPAMSAADYNELRREAAELCAKIAERERFLESELAKPELAIMDVPKKGLGLKGWKATDPPSKGSMREDVTEDERPALHIVAGSGTSASWRTTLRLKPGRYCFEGLVRGRNIQPLPFGKSQGAGLRIAGTFGGDERLLGTLGWQRLRTTFEVRNTEEIVELICELRAESGEVWFAKDSLMVTSAE